MIYQGYRDAKKSKEIHFSGVYASAVPCLKPVRIDSFFSFRNHASAIISAMNKCA